MLVAEYPSLDLYAFVTRFPASLGATELPTEIGGMLAPNFAAPLRSDDDTREAVRDLLRQGGFKPTGRSKPASEYLLKAVADGRLGTINLAVDVCNIVSYHSGLPISVVDLDRAVEPLRVAIAEPGTEYVFNASGQVMDVGGLLCLFDSHGPCANAVKDSQRTKTSPDTCRTLSIIWGTQRLSGRSAQTESWYRQILESAGTATERIWPHRE